MEEFKGEKKKEIDESLEKLNKSSVYESRALRKEKKIHFGMAKHKKVNMKR